VVGRSARAGLLVLPAVMDVRQLLRSAVLAPGNGVVAVEDECRMGVALAHEALLPRAAFLALRPALARVEPRAPPPAQPTTLVLVEQARIRIPRRSIERSDLVLAHPSDESTRMA